MLINHSQLFWNYQIIFNLLFSKLWNTYWTLNSYRLLIYSLILLLIIMIDFSSKEYIIFIFLLGNRISFSKLNILYNRIIILSYTNWLLSCNIVPINIYYTLISPESFYFIRDRRSINWWIIIFFFLILVENHYISLILQIYPALVIFKVKLIRIF